MGEIALTVAAKRARLGRSRVCSIPAVFAYQLIARILNASMEAKPDKHPF